MKRTAIALGVAVAAVASSGCFDIEQTLTLNRDLSGTAGFSMKVDLEPMVGMMAMIQRGFEGKEGPPSAAELEKVRAELLKESSSKVSDFNADKQAMAAELPPGITLVDATFTEAELGVGIGMTFGFDHLSKLAAIEFPKGTEGKKGGPGANPIDAPFAGLRVVDEGTTVLLTGPPQNPLPGAKDQAPPDPETQKMVTDMLKNLRVAFRITAPLEIVQHNAHRREGNTLIWQYDLASLEKLTPAELGASIKVRYRK